MGMKLIDEIGHIYGKLTVIANAGKRANAYWWLCRCLCGVEKSFSGSVLRNGIATHCGCSNANVKNLLGKIFGRLTVLRRTVGRGPEVAWLCKCSCGKEITVTSHHLCNNHTQSCGCLRHEAAVKLGSTPRPRKYTDIESTWQRAYRAHKARRDKHGYLEYSKWKTIVSQDCYYCGRPPSPYFHDYSHFEISLNGVDRIDSSVGYTPINCLPCCWRCNFAKGDMSQAEFYDMIATIALKHNLK